MMTFTTDKFKFIFNRIIYKMSSGKIFKGIKPVHTSSEMIDVVLSQT